MEIGDAIEGILSAFGLEKSIILYATLAFARLFTFWTFIPTLSGDFIPNFLRAGIVMMLTPFIAGGVFAGEMRSFDELYPMFYFLLIKELCLGALLGFLVGLPLRVTSLVGDFVDNQRGAAVAESFNPSTGQQSAVSAQLLTWVVFAYFIAQNGLLYICRLVAASYEVLPIEGFFIYEAFINKDMIAILLHDFLSLFTILALPIMLGMFIAEMGLGVSSRFAQAINVYSLAQPIKSAVAMVLFFFLLEEIIVRNIEFMSSVGIYLFRVGLD